MSVPSAIATPIAVAATHARAERAGVVRDGSLSPVTLRVAPRANRRPVASPMAARAVAAGPDGYSADGMGCAELDEQLWGTRVTSSTAGRSSRSAGGHRRRRGLPRRVRQGYQFGFSKTASGEIVFREWAPAACRAVLIGDFNGWNPDATHLEKDEYGVWSVTLPAGAIEHGSASRSTQKKGDGAWVDRVPAWIKMSYSEPGVMGANYDGIYWDPRARALRP